MVEGTPIEVKIKDTITRVNGNGFMMNGPDYHHCGCYGGVPGICTYKES